MTDTSARPRLVLSYAHGRVTPLLVDHQRCVHFRQLPRSFRSVEEVHTWRERRFPRATVVDLHLPFPTPRRSR